MACEPTLFPPQSPNPQKSEIESVMELTNLSHIQPDLFTNSRLLWQPPASRGIYGGAVIAQSLAAAYETVPDGFYVHSLHSNFIFAGDARFPIMYFVDRIRDGRSFVTRTVHAKQQQSCILMSTISFVRPNSAGKTTLHHSSSPVIDEPTPKEGQPLDIISILNTPMMAYHLKPIIYNESGCERKLFRHWMKARGTISEAAGHKAHSIALAYISDNYFLNAVAVLHDLLPFDGVSFEPDESDEKNTSDTLKDSPIASNSSSKESSSAAEGKVKQNLELGMMVSLDHTIYFHNQNMLRADEWMFSEMTSPWSGEGRGLATQQLYTENGILVASCQQEGIIRVNDPLDVRVSKL